MADQKEKKQPLKALRQLLADGDAEYEILAHEETLRSAEDGVGQGLGRLRDMAPTFILKTEAGFMAAIISGETRFLVLTGFMGAFTTFSTFAFETGGMLRDSQWWFAAGNVLAHNGVGISAALLGMVIAKLF